jgi:hypothetical protein
VNKDLRRILGLPVVAPWSRVYCGNGVLADCRSALWGAMSQAAADLELEFGSASVADWRREVADEEIHHTAAGITAVPAIHWINRPTFQQVVQLPNVDHFKCYRAKSRSGFTQRLVTLTDAAGTRTATVLRPDALCNPVDKNGEGIGDETAHLECYRLKHPRVPTGLVTATNQFGSTTFSAGKPRTLCVPSETDGVPSALDLDHFACAKATHPSPRFTARTVTLADAFETKTTVVRKPDTVCRPVDKNGEGVRNPTSALTCYRVKDASGQTRYTARDVAVANQFGTETVGATKVRTLCVPSALQ